MQNLVYLERKQVPPHLLHDYKGHNLRAIVAETVGIPLTANRWDGGCRTMYRHICLADGRTIHASAGTTIHLDPGYAVAAECSRGGSTFHAP